MTCSASGITADAISRVGGDFEIQGQAAVTSKYTAPVRRTTRKTWDSTSIPGSYA
jgi:hypothetical protein